MLPADLTCLDRNELPETSDDIRLFGVVRNEELRLPAFLEHYRKLGVGRFFFVSNDSTDGTNAFLLAQPDCHIFHTSGSYAAARAGLDWLNPLMDEYGAGHWVVLADADEFLSYPHCEGKDLKRLCAWLDEKHYQGMYTVLLDMYGDQPMPDIAYAPGAKLEEVCPYFDRDYHFARRLGVPFLRPAFPSHEPIGGPRLRLCYPEQNTPYFWPRLRPKLSRRLQKVAQRFGIKLTSNSPAPQAFKIPLVKWQPGYAFVTSHRLNPIRLAPLTGALLHFKYLQDFAARVKESVESGNHYDGSAEYKRYAELLAVNPRLTFLYDGSAAYQSSYDLVCHGIVRDDPDWCAR